MKKLSFFFCVAFAVLAFTACGPVKNIAYLQNSEDPDFKSAHVLYDAHIMPKDQITISVNTTAPEASQPFNLLLQNTYTQGRSLSGSYGVLMPYLVDNEGYINFPIVGKLKVGGLTKSEAENLVAEKIKPYMAEDQKPVVTVTMASYSVSVLGEVNRPGSFQVSREKITLLEALAQAGDLTIYGVRDRVKLIREDATGQKNIVTLNLNDANIVNSPYYYLQQNDVVYVEPNQIKARNSKVGQTTTLWFTGTSILISLASLLANILR